MIRASLVGLAVVCLSEWAQAEEANVGAVGNVGAAPVTSTGGAERFASPNGQLGAGLTSSPEHKGRAFVEMGFGREQQTLSFGGTDLTVYENSLSWILGGGYKLTPELEFVAMLPIAWVSGGVSTTQNGATISNSDSGFGLGNASVGVNYFQFGRPLRYMVGGAVQWGPWTHNYDPANEAALVDAAYARGGHDAALWAADYLTFAVPGRIEYPINDSVVMSGDAALGFHIPTHNGDFEFSAMVAPGVGFYASQTALVGLRVPFTWIPTESGNSATFLSAEPYARFDFGSFFVATRFTLNIDNPLGFSFDSGKWWGIHVGVGGSF